MNLTRNFVLLLLIIEMNIEEFDFIIVGQGISGTVLSHKLLEKGYSVFVFDTYKENSATRIAAGVFNPVAYRKLKMAEFADFLLPEVFQYYTKLESRLMEKIFYPTSFLKILTDIEELNNWQVQCAKEKNTAFMSQDIFTDDFQNSIKNEFGAGQVLQSGVVKLGRMLDLWKDYLISINSFCKDGFQYSEVEFAENEVSYKGIKAKNIIFSEGVGVAQNPWFNWLPMQQFKGEVLEISAPLLKLNRMINRGVFLLPLENGNYKVGATHDWRNVNEIPTTVGKNELLAKLDNIINVPYEVIGHVAGLRPATRDRHPYIGVHPSIKNAFVFNGLGSKGVIMAPWLVDRFVEGLPTFDWPKAFNINRFIRFYNE
jgi:glycine/D-amino acid oxidase-like deaminating enzyme